MAPNVRILRLPCTGRIDALFILKALERGADGVIVSGCHPADCHYTSGNYHARRRFAVFRELASFMGIDSRRVVFSWVSASEGQKWAEVVNQTTEQVRALGPYDAFARLVRGEVAPRPNLAPVPARAPVPAERPSKSGKKKAARADRSSGARSERSDG
jgi:coenzyme F420-reducing hydrogenase delta subunit